MLHNHFPSQKKYNPGSVLCGHRICQEIFVEYDFVYPWMISHSKPCTLVALGL